MSYVFDMICGRDGALWVASPGALFEIKNGVARRWPVENENAVYDTGVLSVCQDEDGVVWAGMTTGIARLKDGQFRYISRKDGLFDNTIYSMVPDDAGFFWVDSDRNGA
jgi:ligand-binding sensor domain-containing protein